jgi:hypothetical protein
MNPLQQFRAIAARATEKLNESFNAPDLVPFGQEMLRLIEAHPEHRAAFVREFINSIGQSSTFDPWLVQFCMHALRWNELKEEFSTMRATAVAENNWNLEQPLRKALEAFDDNWEDAKDFYGEYFAPKST